MADMVQKHTHTKTTIQLYNLTTITKYQKQQHNQTEMPTTITTTTIASISHDDSVGGGFCGLPSYEWSTFKTD